MIRSGGGRRSEVVVQSPPPAYRYRYRNEAMRGLAGFVSVAAHV